MSSSREVTVKKKDVWEEAGSEFYQESYPSGSKPENTHQRRPSRLLIPLPSHTTRRGSLLQGRHNNKSFARRKQTVAAAALTYTSTMAAAEANGTTTNANDIHVAILPDLSEETILNERKTWEELLRIKTMPVPMAQKKQLKAQLTNLPKLRLKGWSQLKWEVKKIWKNLKSVVDRQRRRVVFLHDSLKTIELRSGTSIVNVFLFIKWTLFLNLAMSLLLCTFIIGPYITHDIIQGGKPPILENVTTCADTWENQTLNVESFLDCCRAQYEEELQSSTTSRGAVTALMRELGVGSFERWPLSFSFYYEPYITYEKTSTPALSESKYPFDAMYIVIACVIFLCCLILMVQNIAHGVKEVIQLREGEFYKYSNLIFAGWDHYTNDEQGAEFKRRVLRNEMKIAMQTEKKRINDLLITRKQRVKIYLMRMFVNITVIALIATAALVIIEATQVALDLEGKAAGGHESKHYQKGTTVSRETLNRLAIGFLPSFVISFFNLIFPIILAKLGRLEQTSKEMETTLVLIRALIVRLFSVFAAVWAFYKKTYCVPKQGYCVECDPLESATLLDKRRLCWEAQYADQIYRLIFADLFIKLILTFIVDPLRRLLKHCCSNRVAQRVGTMSFNIVRHSLDVIYIQILSWMSFYFAPFVPVFAVIYCLLVFHIKKFSVLHNCKSVPDTFRTTRTTIMFMIAKIMSFVAVLFAFVVIVGFMVPSRECGPFRGKTAAWTAVKEHLDSYPGLNTFLQQAGSPGVALPFALVLILWSYYYYSVADANRAMVETLRHLLILEGHDKQYLFAKLNSLRRKSQSNSPNTEDAVTLNPP